MVLNYVPDNSNIPTMFSSDACSLQIVFFAFGMPYNFFFLIAKHDVLSKRNCSKSAFSNVVVRYKEKEVSYVLWVGLLVALSLSVNFISVSQIFFSFLKWDKMARVSWSWVFPFSRSVKIWLVFLKASLVKKNREFWLISKWFLSPSFGQKHQGIFLRYLR